MMTEYTDIPLSNIIRDGEPTCKFVNGYRVYSVVENGWVTPYIEFNIPHNGPLSFSLREVEVWLFSDNQRVFVFSLID